ncbi:12316_t:CDS:2 [Ambispora gerdemannii]|uniref:12316_t:CDS:1 n=1 Tax=Ambispora gerdemannii TaxID=144530 RepID=A0A9N8ZW39_9GLOM|nr:12316_t:CDS:2 [Ambispora gerdemannii]
MFSQKQGRKLDPTILYSIRILFKLIIYLCLLAYFAEQIYRISTQHSGLQESRDYPPTIVGPNVRFEFDFNYKLDCQIFYFNATTTDPGTCATQYLLQPEKIDATYYGFLVGNLPFAGYLKSGILKIQITVTLNDAAYNETRDFGFGFRLYDPDPEFENITPKDTTGTLNELDSLNYYVIGPAQANFINYRRFLNQTLTNSWRNTFGAPPTDLAQEYFMTSSFSSIPIIGNTVQKQYASISITLQSTEQDTITEYKPMTVLSILGSLGGAFTLAFGIISFCFGENLLSPFGIAYRFPFIRSKLDSRLQKRTKIYEQHPLAKTNNAQCPSPKKFQAIHSDSSLDNRVAALEDFQEELVAYHGQLLDYQQHLDRQQRDMGLFLSEYVVNVDYVDDLYNIHRGIK